MSEGGPAGGHAGRGQGAGRRGAQRRHEGLRARHPRHPGQHHRDPAEAGLVERRRNILQPTAKGIELIQSIQAETLKSPQMTGEWEARLERIRRGEAQRDEFMGSIRTFVSELVERIKQQAPQGSGGCSARRWGPARSAEPTCICGTGKAATT